MKRFFLFTIVLALSHLCLGQYDDFFSKEFRQGVIFRNIRGSFLGNKSREVEMKYDKQKIYTSYRFDKLPFRLEYNYPIVKEDSACCYFIVGKQKIKLKGLFDDDFACELDVASFKVYKGSFRDKRYILLTSINTGSGSSVSTTICNLFDITEMKAIKYYPLWSKFGSSNFFGDFNHDGILDFVQGRYYKGKRTEVLFQLTSLRNGKFVHEKSDVHEIIMRVEGMRKEVIKKDWY